MELKRSLWLSLIPLLLVLGELSSPTSRSGFQNETEFDFECTNDYGELMFCQFHSLSDGSNCSEYSLDTLRNDSEERKNCVFKQCPSGKCCCSLVEMMLIVGHTHNATLWKGMKLVQSKVISVTDSIKPNAPTITSVKDSNGNFIVSWRTNCLKRSFSVNLIAEVTWRKKGDVDEVSENVTANRDDGLGDYEILTRHLEPSTTYVVSVRSYTNLSHRFSDSSQESEFTTPVSYDAKLLAIIISLSIAAVVITSAVYGCYFKFKAKWWDTVAKCPNPALLNMHPSEPKLLKPSQTSFSSIYVDPPVLNDGKPWSKISLADSSSSGSQQQSSGISTGSPSLSYAETHPVDIITTVQDALRKAFPQLAMMSSVPPSLSAESNIDNSLPSALCNPSVRPDDLQSSPGFSGFDNLTYSVLIPSCDNQAMSVSCGPPIQAVMPCDPAYHPGEGDVLSNAKIDQQEPAVLASTQPCAGLPPVVSSVMQTDFSYQRCNADSTSFFYSEDNSLVSSDVNATVSGDIVSNGKAGCENFAEVVRGATQLLDNDQDVYGEGFITSDTNPCFGVQPANIPQVEDAYQAFQSLVEQPIVMFAEQSISEQGEHLNKYSEESFTKSPRSFFERPTLSNFISDAQAQSLPEVERPFLSFLPADTSMPAITDSGYQSV